MIDDLDEFEAKIHRSKRRRLILGIALSAVAAAGLFALYWSGRPEEERRAERPKLTDDEKAAIRAAIAESRRAIADGDVRWRAAMEAAIAAGPPRDDAPACTALDFLRSTLDENHQTWGSRWRIQGKAPIGYAPYPLTVVEPDGGLPEHGAEAAHRLVELAEVEAELVERTTYRTADDLRMKATVKEPYSVEALFLRGGSIDPSRASSGFFQTGIDVGAGFLYDHRAGRVICAGAVHAESSGTVDTGHLTLDEDLFVNLVRGLPFQIRVVSGP